MRISKRQQEAEIAKTKVEIGILKLQEEHDLTPIEMLQALTSAQQSILKYELRRERHGNYETPAGIDPEEN